MGMSMKTVMRGVMMMMMMIRSRIWIVVMRNKGCLNLWKKKVSVR